MIHISEKMMNAWVDGELSEEEAGSVEVHLRECPSCRETAARLSLLCKALEALPDGPWEPELVPQTIRAWKEERKAAGLRFRLSEWAKRNNSLAYAAMAAGLIIGLVLGSQARWVITPDIEKNRPYVLNYTAETNGDMDPYLRLLVSDDGGDL